jgi:hypothetical protein
MNPAKFFSFNLVLFIHVSLLDVTYERVTPVHMTQIRTMPMSRPATWHHGV